MTLHNLRNNQSGVSLVEVMVALGVSSILMLGMGQFSQMTSQTNAAQDSKSREGAVVSIIANQLSYSDTCGEAFQIGTGNEPVIDNAPPSADFILARMSYLKDPAKGLNIELRLRGLKAGAVAPFSDILRGPTGAQDTGHILLSSRLKVVDLKLHDVRHVLDLANNEKLWRGFVSVMFERLSQQASGGTSLRPNLVGMVSIITAANGAMKRCYSTTPRTLEDICIEMGGDYDKNRTPACQFIAADMDCEPGYALAGIVGGVPYCVRLGGDCNTTNPGFLTAIGLDGKRCAMPADGTLKF